MKETSTDRWPAVRAIAQAELRRLGESLEELSQLHEAGHIDGERAFEITCTRWEAAKTSIRRANRSLGRAKP